MIDPKKWTRHPEPIFTTPNGALEDFVVLKLDDGEVTFHAYYTRGPNLQDQRLYYAISRSPLGPFVEVSRVEVGLDTHTRLYRGRMDAHRRIVTAVWPGLPKAGIWLFQDVPVPGGIVEKKSLLVPPLPDTGFSVAAANPCIVHDGKEWNIYFEGRDEQVFWRCYQACWDDKAPGPVGNLRIIKTALFDGANPSVLQHDGVWYLYASIWNVQKGGFDTWAFSQPVEA